MTGLGPRVVQVLQFAHARGPELQTLQELSQHDAVASVTDAKLEAQKMQRRRRANAFKSYKMPQRLRSTPSHKSSALRCRKHRRRPHKLLQERSSVSDSKRPRWLSTHKWHAKRMVMQEQYGYMLALHRSDKSVSAALQAVRKMATLHDCSYYGIIELFGLPQVILETLQMVSDPTGSAFHERKFLAGAEEGASMLYHGGQFPQGAIAPVSFMWRPLKNDYKSGAFELQEDWPSTKRQLWLWVHPAAYMEAATAIATACHEVVTDEHERLEMHDRRGQLSRLKVRGRRAEELVAILVAGQGEAEEEEEDGDESEHEDGYHANETRAKCSSGNRRHFLRVLRETRKTSAIPEQNDTIYALAVKDPRLARYQGGLVRHEAVRVGSELSLLHEPPVDAVPETGTSVITSPLSGLSLSSLGHDAEEPEPLVILNELQSLLAWTKDKSGITDTSRYPSVKASENVNERETKDDSCLERSPSSMLWSLSKRQTVESTFLADHTLNEELYRQRKDGTSINGVAVKCPPLHLVAIEKRESYPHLSGWDLICTPSHAPSLLKALVFNGAMVIGLEEDSALSTVVHQPSFPRDYPDTQAGQVFWDTRARDVETKQARKPKAKRLNHEKHDVKSPYRPRWELVFREEDDTLAPCVLRGRKYMEPFCFDRSTSTASENMTPSSVIADSLVSVSMPTLVRVVIVIPRRGKIEINAMLVAPSAEDGARFRKDNKWMGYEIKSDKTSNSEDQETHERSLIGFVTSAVYDRPKSAFRAIGFIACEALQHLFIANQQFKRGQSTPYALAMLRSPQSRMVRPVLVQAEP